MTGADRTAWLFRAACWLALTGSLLAGVGCTRTRCHTEPLAMHWADGTTTTWTITVCRRGWL